jgi:hypothetical protein
MAPCQISRLNQSLIGSEFFPANDSLVMPMAQFRLDLEFIWQSNGDANGTIPIGSGVCVAEHWRCQWHNSDWI